MSKVKDDALKEATKRIKLQPRNAYPGPGHLECLGREKDPVRIEIDVERAKRLRGYANLSGDYHWERRSLTDRQEEERRKAMALAWNDRDELDRLIKEAEDEI